MVLHLLVDPTERHLPHVLGHILDYLPPSDLHSCYLAGDARLAQAVAARLNRRTVEDLDAKWNLLVRPVEVAWHRLADGQGVRVEQVLVHRNWIFALVLP